MASEAPASPSAAPGLSIETPRLTIRTARPSDAAALVAYFSDPANFPWDPEPDLTLDKMLARIAGWARAAQERSSAFMAVVQRGTGQLVGFGGFNGLPRTEPLGGDKPVWRMTKKTGGAAEQGTVVVAADMGISIAHEHQRKGYAREAICALLEYAFFRLGCAYAHMDTQRANGPMRALMAGLGVGAVEGDGGEPPEDAAFCFAARSVNYDLDMAAFASLKSRLEAEGKWPL